MMTAPEPLLTNQHGRPPKRMSVQKMAQARPNLRTS